MCRKAQRSVKDLDYLLSLDNLTCIDKRTLWGNHHLTLVSHGLHHLIRSRIGRGMESSHVTSLLW